MVMVFSKKAIKKWIEIDLIFVLIALGYYFLTYAIGETCLIKFIVGRECPTCGCTRALICLLSFDLNGYFGYNGLALPTILIVYGYVHFGTKYKKIFNILAIIIAVALVFRYIIIYF